MRSEYLHAWQVFSADVPSKKGRMTMTNWETTPGWLHAIVDERGQCEICHGSTEDGRELCHECEPGANGWLQAIIEDSDRI
jgi:uncharacterized cupin superfamily protein